MVKKEGKDSEETRAKKLAGLEKARAARTKKAKEGPKAPTKQVLRNGAPSEFCEDVREKILAAVRRGNFLEVAAATAGIHKDTFFRWMRKGRKDLKEDLHSEYRDFYISIHTAQAEKEDQLVDVMQQHVMQGNVDAAKFLLSRRYRSGWGVESVQVNMEHSGSVNIDSTRKELKELAKTAKDKEAVKKVARLIAARRAEKADNE